MREMAHVLILYKKSFLVGVCSDKAMFPGYLDIPGGGLEIGELPRDAVIRETFEETGLVLDSGRLAYMGYTMIPWDSGEARAHSFCYFGRGETITVREDKIRRWIYVSDLDDCPTLHVTRAAVQRLKGHTP